MEVNHITPEQLKQYIGRSVHGYIDSKPVEHSVLIEKFTKKYGYEPREMLVIERKKSFAYYMLLED